MSNPIYELLKTLPEKSQEDVNIINSLTGFYDRFNELHPAPLLWTKNPEICQGFVALCLISSGELRRRYLTTSESNAFRSTVSKVQNGIISTARTSELVDRIQKALMLGKDLTDPDAEMDFEDGDLVDDHNEDDDHNRRF